MKMSHNPNPSDQSGAMILILSADEVALLENGRATEITSETVDWREALSFFPTDSVQALGSQKAPSIPVQKAVPAVAGLSELLSASGSRVIPPIQVP